ncbi:MAG: hypothetical protein K0Q49_1580 [Haloplasmataceae bacterium]|jgi:lysophospholipid acyltransferase (LPLAT)-like uncharacterized protein|nr:hypothetical protein [Haloplasmataceae bacterium]
MLGNIFSKFFIYYIKFVYRTSKIISKGNYHLLNQEEKYIFGFWHGNSYTAFPYLRDGNMYIITTVNKRGDYISALCDAFKYHPIRVPDESEAGGNFLFKIRREINGEKKANLATTLDGPLGPYHEPKSFPFMVALLNKRQFVCVSIKCKRKINLNKRWDKYVIPLPFNKIELNFSDPIDVTKADLNEDFKTIKEKVKKFTY